jgi:alpha-ribazole phosphatase
MADALELWIWRHPRPIGAHGRCIGRTDIDVDPRRAKRLARRIAAAARRANLPREIWTSPSRRCADVGRHLKRLGFVHRADERLRELDFGDWDGLCWDAIDPADVARWEADFAHHAPGGGEPLSALATRARGFLAERAQAATESVLIVGHGGWINAMRTCCSQPPAATHWPQAIGYGAMLRHRWTPT